FTHLLSCDVQVRISPGVTRIEPHAEMAVLAPCRSCRLNDLLCGVPRQVFTWRCQAKISFVCRLANKLFEETRSFEPPVPKQFCIKWGDDNRVEPEIADLANLLPSLFQKVTRVLRRSIFRRAAIIQLFVIPGSGDPVVLHTREFSASPRNRP